MEKIKNDINSLKQEIENMKEVLMSKDFEVIKSFIKTYAIPEEILKQMEDDKLKGITELFLGEKQEELLKVLKSLKNKDVFEIKDNVNYIFKVSKEVSIRGEIKFLYNEKISRFYLHNH